MAKNKITIKKNKDGKVTGIDIGNKSLKQHSQNSITSQVDPDTFLIQTVKGKDGTDGNPGIDGLNGIDGSNGLDGKPGLDGKDYNPKIEEQVNTSTKDISSAKKSIDSLISAEKTIKDDISTLDNNINIHIEDEGIHFDDLDQKEEVLEYIKNPQQVITDGGGVGPHNNLQKLQGGDPTKPKEYYHLIADDYGHIVNEDYLFRDGSLPMTGNLDMDDNHIIDPGYIQFDTDFTDGFNEGRLQWNNDCGTLEFGLPGGNVNLQIGQELLIRAKNTSGETITNGSPVYISGADGAKPTIGLASATNHIIANATIAVATEDITSQQFGYVTVFGLVRGMDTSFAVADGGPAFLSATTGELSGTLPEQPNSQVFIGVVLRKHAEEGVILVKIIPQPNLEELSDVLIDSAAAGDLIQWDNTNSRWYNSDIFNKTLEPTGFPNRTDSTIAFTAIDMTFSIQPVATSFDFYSLGVKFTSTGDTVVVDDVEGLWFFYYDSSGVLIASQTPWDFTSGFVYAAIIYWDAVNKTNLGLGEERHGITMDSATHEYLHEHFGAVWGSGFTPSVTVDGNGSLDAHCEIQSVSSGILYDEDIEHNSDEQTNSFIMLYKQSSGSYFRKEILGNALVAITNVRPDYNEFIGGSWQRTEVSNTKFTLTHLFATNSTNPSKNILVMGENEYNSKSDAQDGALIELTSLVTGALPTPEFSAIATFIIECKDAYTNIYNARVVSTSDGGEFVDFRTSEKTGVGAVATDHGNLAGLTDDDHTQYLLADGTRSATSLTVIEDLTVGGNIVGDTDGYITSDGGLLTTQNFEFADVVNGSFDTDISGWSTSGDGTWSWDTGRAKITGLGSSQSGSIYPTTSITPTVGKRYKVTASYQTANATMQVTFAGETILSVLSGVSETATTIIKATSTDNLVATVAQAIIPIGVTGYLDDVSIEELGEWGDILTSNDIYALDGANIYSSKDISLAGLLTNTLTANDTKGLYINGEDNPYTGDGSATDSPMNLATLSRTIDSQLDLGSMTINMLKNYLFIEEIFNTSVNSQHISGVHNYLYVADGYRSTSTNNATIAGTLNEVRNYGTTTLASSSNYTNYGTKNYIVDAADINATGDSLQLINYGTYNWITSSAHTETAGSLGVNSYGTWTYLAGTTAVTGVTNNFGVYFDTISGADNNWGIYNNTSVDNLMGLDGSETFFGTDNDLSIQHNTTDSIWNGNINDTGSSKFQDNGTTRIELDSTGIGLYGATPVAQATTSISASTFVANTSGISDDTATFDGYTIGQIVKALRSIGALA